MRSPLPPTASDGTLTPRQLVALAKETGLAAVAITDHDTVDGLQEGASAAICRRLLSLPELAAAGTVFGLGPGGPPYPHHRLGRDADPPAAGGVGQGDRPGSTLLDGTGIAALVGPLGAGNAPGPVLHILEHADHLADRH